MKFKNEWLTECKLSIIFKETRRLQSSKEKTVETTNEKKRRERENAETTIGKNAERESERD